MPARLMDEVDGVVSNIKSAVHRSDQSQVLSAPKILGPLFGKDMKSQNGCVKADKYEV